MKAIFFSALLLSSTVFAQSRIQKERKIKKIASKVSELAQYNIDTVNNYELDDLLDTLKKARRILNGRNVDPSPVPTPAPVPVPIPVYSCADDSTYKYQEAFIKLKDFAYSNDGYNYYTNKAIQFAQQWTKEFPCDYADKFIQDSKRLKIFAYSGSGLDYYAHQAVTFAKEKISTFCSNYNLEQEFKSHYDFAYSSSGLNMYSSQAKKYAYEKIELRAFSCNHRNQFSF